MSAGRGRCEEFHPYGSTAWWFQSTTVSLKRYRYTGMERDEETGLQCHGVRYYASWLGRWCSADPIGLGDGVNRYQYVHAHLIISPDHSGREEPKTWHGGDHASDPGFGDRVAEAKTLIGTLQGEVSAGTITSGQALVSMFSSDDIHDGGSATERLSIVLAATRETTAPDFTHFGFDEFDSTGFRAEFRDLSPTGIFSDNQLSHFLTAMDLGYSPQNTMDVSVLLVVAPDHRDDDATERAVRLIVGHEQVADAAKLRGPRGAWYHDRPAELKAGRDQYRAPTKADLDNFEAGNLDAIRVGSGYGDSRQDLGLSYVGWSLGGIVRANEDAAVLTNTPPVLLTRQALAGLIQASVVDTGQTAHGKW